MAHSYPKDRFDAVPDDLRRVGAHRAPRSKARAWIWIGWCALAIVLIVGAGILGISIINGNVDVPGFSAQTTSGTPTATSTPTPTITPIVDPKLNITVLNGTNQPGLAGEVATTLGKAGWKHISTANASQTDLKKTVIYYSADKNRAAALGAARSLPGATVSKTQDFVDTGADLTVVVGSDQVPSG
ncbi:MAG TPA: LytR C-terminal domain-containing protein [Humibacter sp.]|nr:LytR C-terminal domain-containing protein [Humibacter sp.]